LIDIYRYLYCIFFIIIDGAGADNMAEGAGNMADPDIDLEGGHTAEAGSQGSSAGVHCNQVEGSTVAEAGRLG